MLDQEKREAERKTAQSRNIEEQSVEAGKTAARGKRQRSGNAERGTGRKE